MMRWEGGAALRSLPDIDEDPKGPPVHAEDFV